jgi:outer membrane receptor protein involved in Fe transport
MKNKALPILLTLLFLAWTSLPFRVQAQQAPLTGTISDAETKAPLVGVSIQLKGKLTGTVTDGKGFFSLPAQQTQSLTVIISMIGYQTQEVTLTSGQTDVSVALQPQIALGQEVVVSASRVEESILRSPVSVEKMDRRAIQQTPSLSFYDGLQSMKSIDMVTSGLTYKVINTRGFASTGNSRFLQLVDGVDNQTPGLNFAVGNLFGMSDLDAESVELVPGAASALYGPVAFNGVLRIATKNPFQYQGLSVQGKLGVNHVNDPATGAAPLYEGTLRYAKAIGNRFAYKVNASYLKALDWYATDYTDIDPNTPAAQRGDQNPGRNALNIYGDEVARNLPGIGRVSRTGYEEKDVTDYHVYSLKLSGALHYRLTDNLEAIYQYNYNEGTANYTGSSRFSLNHFIFQQHRLELKGSKFFVRAYTNLENSNQSYNARTMAQQINRTWVRDLNGNVVNPGQADGAWFDRYAAAFSGQVNGVTANNPATARGFADQGRLQPGSSEFEQQKSRLQTITGPNGAGIYSSSKLYHVEGQYDLSQQVKLVEMLVGGNFRRYDMFTNGTLLADLDKNVTINEYGTFLQVAKGMWSDRLKVTLSGRYDKNENFDGYFTPRASAVFSPHAKHNFRTSYQTGFRNPTPVDQFINLNAGVITILGGVPANSRGTNVYENSFTAASAGAFGAGFGADLQKGLSPQQAIANNKDKLQQSNVAYIKPERVESFEVGYKGLLTSRLFLDANYYFSSYRDFILNQVVIRPDNPVLLADGTVNPAAAADVLNNASSTPTSRLFQLYTNAQDRVTSQGATLGLTYALPKGYSLGGNGTWATFDLRNANPNDIPAFNTPRYKSNVTFGNRNVFRNLGFNLAWHWQDAYDWFGSFNELRPGRIPAYHMLDAQVSYQVKSLKSVIKLGANNLTNQRIVQVYGSPAVGDLYYVSITFDELLH